MSRHDSTRDSTLSIGFVMDPIEDIKYANNTIRVDQNLAGDGREALSGGHQH